MAERERISVLPTLEGKIESRCNVCTSASRTHIDRLIAAGFSDTAIAQQIMNTEPQFKGSRENKKDVDRVRRSVGRHRERHLNLQERTTRMIIERRAKEAGMVLEEHESQLATTKALLELVIAKGMSQVTDPDTRVKFQDALRAVELLEGFDREAYMQELSILKRQTEALAQAVREVVPSDFHADIITRAHEIFEGGNLLESPRQALEAAQRNGQLV